MELIEIIKKRRSIDPDDFNGKMVTKNIIEQMLDAANWAPTHGYTEPWRFIVFSGAQAQAFGVLHADLYKKWTPNEQFLQKKYDKIKHRPQYSSHVIACVNHRGGKSNIPELEEIAATSCAIQNMLLVATLYDVGTFWSTGGMCYHPAMKEVLELDEKDQVMGFIYVGYYDSPHPDGTRTSSWKDKIIWK